MRSPTAKGDAPLPPLSGLCWCSLHRSDQLFWDVFLEAAVALPALLVPVAAPTVDSFQRSSRVPRTLSAAFEAVMVRCLLNPSC